MLFYSTNVLSVALRNDKCLTKEMLIYAALHSKMRDDIKYLALLLKF